MSDGYIEAFEIPQAWAVFDCLDSEDAPPPKAIFDHPDDAEQWRREKMLAGELAGELAEDAAVMRCCVAAAFWNCVDPIIDNFEPQAREAIREIL